MAHRDKTPVRLTGLRRAFASWKTMHPQQGELPAAFALDFTHADGPAIVSDGRLLRASITPAELADLLGAIPALTLASDDDSEQAANVRACDQMLHLLKGDSHDPGH